MSQKILIKRSTTASTEPTASDLDVGELGLNTADAKLFTKHTDGTVKLLSGEGISEAQAAVIAKKQAIIFG